LKFRKYLNDFCLKHEYIGSINYNNQTKEYSIIISKNENNAGVFLSKDELLMLNNETIENLLNFLHKGFIKMF
jgi:hypothetical protein